MKTAEALRTRISILSNKDPVANAKIINKLKRKIRKIESNN